jgi:hypothetical protein
MKFKSLEHFARDVMEKKDHDMGRYLHDMQKHLSPEGETLNPAIRTAMQSQSIADTQSDMVDKSQSITDTPSEKKDEQDKSITDQQVNGSKKELSKIDIARNVLKIRNMRAQNKTKIIDNA